MSKRIQSAGFVIVFCFTLLVSVNLSTVGTVDISSGYAPAMQGPTSAAVGQVGTFPAQNGQLLPDENYNLTASLRDEANLGRAYDGGYLTVTKSGDVYRNTTFTPLGTFPGTYSFENDRSGGLAAGWTYGIGTSCSAQVASSYLGHSQVMQLYDNQAGGRVEMNNSFPAQSSGNVSFWWLVSDVSKRVDVWIEDAAANAAVGIAINTGNLIYWDGSGPATILQSVVSNTWYHINIEFGSTADKYNLYINGQRKVTGANYFYSGTNPTVLIILTDATMTGGYSAYIDAVDYSWMSDYVPLGNARDLSLFGIYNATYSFENDSIFAQPSGFSCVEQSAGDICVYPIVPTAASGHKNVLRARSGLPGWSTANLTLPMPQTGTCSYEYFAYFTTIGIAVEFNAMNNSHGYGPILHSDGANLQYRTNDVWYTIMALSANTWYHFRMVVSVSSRAYDVYVNGVLRATGLPFDNQYVSELSILEFAANNAEGYFDAIDISMDPQYAIERSTYMLLQSNQTFSDAGAYSFRYTLTSSGTDYVPSWTPFTVVVPEEPEVPTHNIFFSASSSDLSGVPEDTAFLYLDGALKKWGTVDLVNGTHNVTVRDYFGVVIFSENVTFIAGGNYGIELPMATLVVNNFHDEPVALEITKAGGTGTLRQLMGSQDSFTVRLTTGTYHVRLYDLDGNLVGEYAMVTLTAGASEARDFGEAPSLFALDWIILVGLISVCAVLILVTIARTGRGWREGRR